jgi:hypothetical protein
MQQHWEVGSLGRCLGNEDSVLPDRLILLWKGIAGVSSLFCPSVRWGHRARSFFPSAHCPVRIQQEGLLQRPDATPWSWTSQVPELWELISVLYKLHSLEQDMWLIPVISATWEVKKGGLQFETSPGKKKKLVRLYLMKQAGPGGAHL